MFGVVGELSWATGAAAAAVDDVCLHNCHFSTAVLAGLAALATAIVTRQRGKKRYLGEGDDIQRSWADKDSS